jgi:hypothetical protein
MQRPLPANVGTIFNGSGCRCIGVILLLVSTKFLFMTLEGDAGGMPVDV